VFPDDGLVKTKTCRSICYILNANFNVLKQNYCALVGLIKDWITLVCVCTGDLEGKLHSAQIHMRSTEARCEKKLTAFRVKSIILI